MYYESRKDILLYINSFLFTFSLKFLVLYGMFLASPFAVLALVAQSDVCPRLDPSQVQQPSFVEIDHEIFSKVILSLLLIQKGQL